jgi:hypothetical protein
MEQNSSWVWDKNKDHSRTVADLECLMRITTKVILTT